MWPTDTWQIHFRDTMVGGKLLNNPRMAELHAQGGPGPRPRARAWGAVFDRTPDGRMLQRRSVVTRTPVLRMSATGPVSR